MSSDLALRRTLVAHSDLPLVVMFNDADPSRLRARAREFCDDRFAHWSRSYSGDLALVAGWHLRVGVDVELLDRSSSSSWSLDDQNFRRVIMTPEERQLTSTDGTSRASISAIDLWCSKEALAKALGSPLEIDPTRLTGPPFWSGLARGAWRARSLDDQILGRDAVGWVVYEAS